MQYENKLFGNKYINFGFILDKEDFLLTSRQFLNFNFTLNRKMDHSGLDIGIDILGLYLFFKVYDNRHWDFDNECWCK